MRLADYVALAFRSVRRQKLRAALTIAAIVIGATGVTVMLTFVSSIKSYTLSQFERAGEVRQIAVGPEQDLTFSQYGNESRGGLKPSGTTVGLTPTLVTKIERLSHVVAATPTLNGKSYGPGLEALVLGSRELLVNRIEAYIPNGVIKPDVIAGRALSRKDKVGRIMLSQEYADALGFKGAYAGLVGRTVQLRTQPGYTGFGAKLPALEQCGPTPTPSCKNPDKPPSTLLPARVVGVTGRSGGGLIFMTLAWALLLNDSAHQEGGTWVRPTPLQALLDRAPDQTGGYDSLILDVDDTANVAAVAAAIRKLGLGAATAQEVIDQEVRAFNAIAFVLGALGLVALLIAALGVVNTMVMAVLERTREIGVMRAVGARRSTIRRLFTMEAAALGFLGGAIGVAIGYAAVLVANPIINQKLKVNHVRGSDILSVPLWLAAGVIVGTTLIGVVSGLLPARRAARLDPVEALRYE